MAQSTASKLRKVSDLDIIVDADGHVVESMDDVLPYLNNKAVKKALSFTDNFNADVMSYNHIGPVYSGSFEEGNAMDERKTYSKGSVVNDDIKGKYAELDEFDVDYSVISPTLFMTSHVTGINNTRHAISLTKAYNKWALDKMGDDDRLKLTLPIPQQRPNIAAEEIDRWGDEQNVVGVALSGASLTSLGSDLMDPVYDAMSNHGLVGTIHGGTLGPSESFTTFYQMAETFTEGHAVGMPWSLQWAMNSLIFNGVAERYPDIDFVLQEGGIGWVPFMKWRMDDHYLQAQDDVPDVQKLPSEYVDDSFYFATQPIGRTTGENVSEIIKMTGPENILYGADLPHFDWDPPEELFDKISPYFDEDILRGIMGENAMDIYSI